MKSDLRHTAYGFSMTLAVSYFGGWMFRIAAPSCIPSPRLRRRNRRARNCEDPDEIGRRSNLMGQSENLEKNSPRICIIRNNE
jgi:hypothetical protein